MSLIKGPRRAWEKRHACTDWGKSLNRKPRIMSFLGIKTNKQIFKRPPGCKAYLFEVCGYGRGRPQGVQFPARLPEAPEPDPLCSALLCSWALRGLWVTLTEELLSWAELMALTLSAQAEPWTQQTFQRMAPGSGVGTSLT